MDVLFKLFIVLIFIVNIIRCDITPQVLSISDQIYVDLEYAFPCVRILTENGQFGCSSKMDGNSGTLYLVDSDDSLNDLMNGHKNNVLLVLDANYFNKTIVNNIITKKIKIEGIIVLTDKERTYPYSPDVTYPNKKYGLYPNSQIAWNPNGDSFSYQDFQFPIFSTDFNYSYAMRNLSLSNREGGYPAYGADLRSFMQASQDAETCLRRGFCAPLGGKSIWSTFSKEVSQQQDILLVMIPMDSTAFFHDLATGADAVAYGQVVLLSIMDTLSRVNQSQWNMQLIFAMWNGEKWGYLGTSKFVDDLLNFNCTQVSSQDPTVCQQPVNYDMTFETIDFQRIKMIVELNQIGLPERTPNNQSLYYLHSYQPTTVSKQMQDVFVGHNQDNGTEIQYLVSTATELPPSSTMSFLKFNPQIQQVVVTDHNMEYRNPFYASHDDDVYNVDPDILPHIVKSLSVIIDQLAGGNNSAIISANPQFYYTMFSCLLESFTCTYVDQYLNKYPFNPIPNFYSSIYGTAPYNQFNTIETQFFYNIMWNITTNQMNTTAQCKKTSDCQESLPGSMCLNGMCMLSNTHYHDAISLGLGFDDTTSSWFIQNSSYPIFVESNWDYTDLRVYLLSNPSTEVVFLIMGIFELTISIVIIILIKKHLSKKYKLL
ncbi:nicastrin [Tieghemostelium lacteum]|uniref:Nicastrin n=1 Tax=Tieghemostelium lacteum TaxID=361077 RepID=A0A152AA04_TIELA|nr:nicastrin [Tieghemostelium lacteum]|eukprot:KYR03053.1 nicastrin [Tieghemostelium lacteum]